MAPSVTRAVCAFALRLAAALAGFTATPSVAQTHSAPPELAGLDAFVLDALERARAPGAAIAIVKDGKVILSKGYGVRSARTGLPMDSATLFPIQSETKAFTALSAVMLRDEGMLDLDAPVSTYIPGFRLNDPVATQEVSLRDFLTHRSGLGVYSLLWIANDGTNRADAVRRMAHLPPAAPFRAKWAYSNMGYVAAANAVERVAGVPWERLVEGKIFAPLGMARTTFSREQALGNPNHTEGSMFWNGRLMTTPMQTTTPMTNSTGGIISTADDLAKWMLFQLDGGRAGGKQLVKAESIAETHEPRMVSQRPVPPPEFTSSAYGLGWFVESYRGERLIEHGGNHWGVNSAIGLFPDRKLGISVFVNEDSDLGAYLMLGIADRFIGPGARDWVQLAAGSKPQKEADHRASVLEQEKQAKQALRPARALSEYAGTYTHPGFGSIIVRQEKSGLAVQHDNDVSPLVSTGSDVFVPTATQFGNVWAMLDAVQVQFVPGYDGRISSLRTTATVDGVVFRKD
jgi:CubicO group peptidase (beta-lactamase class C family)